MSAASAIQRPTWRSWRPRFRLRTVLLVMTLFALPLGALGVVFERARERARMIDALAQLGGQPMPAWIDSHGRLVSGRRHGEPIGAWEWLATLGGQERFVPILKAGIDNSDIDADRAHLLDQLAGLEALALHRCRLSPEARVAFARWRKLKVLHVGGADFVDDDLASFANCRGLVALHIDGGRLSPPALAQLEGFPNLAHLHLDMKPLSGEHVAQLRHAPMLRTLHLAYSAYGSLDDAALLELPALPQLEELELKWNRALRGPGLACVRRLPKLRWLNVDECPLEDEGLRHLEHAPQLGQLILDASRISPEAVDRLMKAHPKMGFADTSGTY